MSDVNYDIIISENNETQSESTLRIVNLAPLSGQRYLTRNGVIPTQPEHQQTRDDSE